MDDMSLLNENWQVLLSLFPLDWKEQAKQTGAMVRKFRSFPSEESLMRTLLMHIAKGYSLRETVVRAKAANIAEVSDVALLKRLRLSEQWLKALCHSLFAERKTKLCNQEQGSKIRMRLVDATNVKEPGKTGSLWRIHYSLSLPDLGCDYFKITAVKGVGTGETFIHFPVQKGDCILGDRGYSSARGISYIAKKGGYSLTRVNTGSLKFYINSNKKFDLLKHVKKLKTAGQVGEWSVKIKVGNNKFISGRICAIRKSEMAISKALKNLGRDANRKQKQVKTETLEYAKYIIVFTTLSKQDFAAQAVLEWYRTRWQIELVFKRLKSLAGLGHLPKYDEVSARSWLYGKLFVGLLTDKLIRQANEISPWGYELPQ